MQCTCDCMSATLAHLNSYSCSGTRASSSRRRKALSSGRRKSSALPVAASPRAVRPTRWMYDFGSSGGSYCTIQSTRGMSRPRAATSVQRSTAVCAWQNWRKVVVRRACFCFPCNRHQVSRRQAKPYPPIFSKTFSNM